MKVRLAKGRLFSYVCPDCGQSNGGGVDGDAFNEWRKRDRYSPLNKPCIFCGKGPMVMKFGNRKAMK